MTTMVAEPYLDHVPVMTGGVGYDGVYRFYKRHFIPKWPRDTQVLRLSRTVGDHQLVDELVISFTHDREMDFMLPGVSATGRRVELPGVVVVKFERDKVAHEHIYWDQASLLVQVGVLDPTRLPVTGAEQAHKLLDKTLPTNTRADADMGGAALRTSLSAFALVRAILSATTLHLTLEPSEGARLGPGKHVADVGRRKSAAHQ
jgi:carboxymethylenebutenolidase